MNNRSYSEAQQLYREALTQDETYSEARLALANLFLLKGELELCEQECVSLLRIDPDNESATLVGSGVIRFCKSNLFIGLKFMNCKFINKYVVRV